MGINDEAIRIFLKRFDSCLMDLGDNLPIDLSGEIKNLKLDLILWALRETNKNATQAAKILGMNRTTMVSMVNNELSTLLEMRRKDKFSDAASGIRYSKLSSLR
jgi:hypothetical protein